METKGIGNFIKKRRKELGLSQFDIAEFLSVSIPTVSKWENNERVPDLSLFSSLSKILKVDLESLIKGKSILKNNYDIENEFNIDSFAKYFSYLRKRNNYTLSSLANALDISYQTISKWENKESLPTIYTLIECSKIFKVSLFEIYYGKEFKEENNDNKKTTNKVMFVLTSIFLLIAIIVSTIFINNNNKNSNDSQKDFVIYLKDNNYAVIDEYIGDKKEVIVPSTIVYNDKEVEVKEIAFNLLGKYKDIEKLTIPFIGKTNGDSEENYLGYLFGAESFSFNEFYVPKSLKEVIITNATHITKYAFYNCKYIEKVILSNNLESIGMDAFLGCDSLKYNKDESYIYLGNEKNKYFTLLKPINNEQFEYLINDNVKIIGREAFKNCKMMSSIEISKNVMYICEDAFSGLKNIKSVYYQGTLEDWCRISFYNFRSNPMYLSDSSFYLKDENRKYQEITEIIIPYSINIIGKHQFDGFTKIGKVYIGDNVISIEEKAFAYCSSLKSIFIPKSVVKIGRQVFVSCENIKIYCEAEEKPAGWSDDWHYNSENVTWNCSRE